MSLAVDFIIDLAASLAFEVSRAGVTRLSIAVFGSPEEQALRRIYDRAFQSMLKDITADLDRDVEDWIEDTFRRFVRDPDVTDTLLNLALEGANAPDLNLLQNRFRALGFESQGIPVDFPKVLMTFHEALTQAVNDEASRSESPLHNIVSVKRIVAIQKSQDEITLQLESLSDHVADKVRETFEATLKNALKDPLASQQSAPLTDFPDLSNTMAASIQDFLANYSSFFTGRKENIEELTTWLEQPTNRIGMLMTPAGRGKSALIVNWIAELRKSTDYHVIFFPVSWRFQTNQRRSLLEMLIAYLARVHGDPLYNLPSQEENSLVAELKLLLNKGFDDNQKVVVVIDGLDELDTLSASEAAIFPASVAPGCHLLVTMRGETEQDRQMWLELLGWTDIEVQSFGLGLLQQGEILDLIQRYSRYRAPDIEAELSAQIFTVSNGGDPLVVSLYVQDWYRFVDQHVLHRPPTEADLHSFGIAQRQLGLNGYLRGIKDQFKTFDDELGSFFDVLSLARGPLTTNDLDGLGIDVSALPVVDITNSSRGLVIGDGLHRGFIFSHPRIAYVYRESHDLLPARRLDAWQKRFLEYGQRTVLQLATGTLSPIEVSPYILRHYLSHLLDTPSDDRLTELSTLFVHGWIQAHAQVFGGYQYFFGDLQRIWDFAHDYAQHTSDNNLIAESAALCWKCAFCFASASSLASRLPPHLPALLFKDQLWTLDQTLYYAYRVPDHLQRIRTLLALLKTDGVYEKLSDRIVLVCCEKIIEALPQIEDAELRYRLLLDVIPFARWQSLQDLLQHAIVAIEDVLWKVRALSELARFSLLASSQLQARALQIMAARKYRGDELEPYQYALKSLARSLCQTRQLTRAWNLAFISPPVLPITDASSTKVNRDQSEIYKEYLLSQLASHIPDDCADEFLEICLSEASAKNRDLALPRIVIILAPHLSLQMARKALEVLLPSEALSQHHLGRWFRPLFEAGGLSLNELVAATVIGHTTHDVHLRQLINGILDTHLQPVQDSNYTWSKISSGARTFREILLGQCTVEQFSEHMRRGAFSTEISDHALFRYIKPAFSEALIANTLHTDIHEFDTRGTTIELRTSDFLTSYAQCLDKLTLHHLFGMVPGHERSGRLRAIATSAHRMSVSEIQQAIEYIFNSSTSLFSDLDSTLAALSAIAPYLTSNRLAEFISKPGRYEQDYWQHWMILENIAPHLNRNIITTTIQTALSELSIQGSLRQLQGVAVLAAQLNSKKRLPILQQVKQWSSRIGDLPQRYNAVQHMSTRTSWRYNRHIRNRATEQVRTAIRSEALTSADRNDLILLLPFAERTTAMLRHRQSIIIEDKDGKLQSKSVVRILGYSLYRTRFILSLLRTLSELFVVLILLPIVVLIGEPNSIRVKGFLIKLVSWQNQIEDDASAIPNRSVFSAIILRWAEKIIRMKNMKPVSIFHFDYFDHLVRVHPHLHTLAPAGIEALKKDLLRTADLRGSDDYRSAIINLFSKCYVPLSKCILDRHQIHADALILFEDIPSEMITTALDVLLAEIQDKHSLLSFEEEGTLVVLIPVLARLAPKYLPVIASIVENNAQNDYSYHGAAIVLAHLSEYSEGVDQRQYLASAVRMALRRYENKEHTCGIVLEHAAEFASPTLLHIVATYLRDCWVGDTLNDSYYRAMVTIARRLPDDISILDLIWPVVERTKNVSLTNIIIENAGPHLDINWITRLFVFAARDAEGLHGTSGYVLRKRWKQQSLSNQLEMLDFVLRQLCDLPRPVFLDQITWLWSTFASLGVSKNRMAYSLTSAILDVGDWWP